jgi:hypothetical protein
MSLFCTKQDSEASVFVTENETLVRRGKKWFRYDAPDKRLFKKLQKTLMALWAKPTTERNLRARTFL